MTITCYSSSEDKKIAYAQIRNQVAALQDLIRVCNRRHNDLNITARLPDDILSEIFQWIRSFQPSGNDKPSWFRVAFVCAEWRRVAIDCAALWTRFSHEKHVEWLTQVIIPRSKNTLLSVNMSLNLGPSRDKQWEGAHSLLRDHSGRVREIGLNFLAHSVWQPAQVEDLLSRLANPLPSLEIFHVSVIGYAARETMSISSNVVGEVHAPNLKSLTLVGAVKLSPAPCVPLLITTLTLEYGQWSKAEIVLLLEACKKLQNLMLKSTSIEDPSSSLDDTSFKSPVVLRELKRFTLDNTCKRCLSILSSISCPAATNIKVILPSCYPDDFRELGQKLATLIDPVKSLTIQVSPFDDDEFGRTVWLSVRGPPNIESQHWSPSDSPEPDQPDLELSIQTWAHSKTIFSTLFTPFDLQELEILEVSPAVSAKILKENFGRLTLLHTISIVEELYCKATDEVADALFGDDVSPTSLQSRSWYLGIRNSRLNPRVVDIDAQNEVLSIVQNNFLATITAPLPFPALKCLKNVSTGNADLSLRLGVVFLLRQTLGIPLREVYLHPMYGGTSLDGLDFTMMRQSVEVFSHAYDGSRISESDPN